MHDLPITRAEIDAWLLALLAFDVIHDAAHGPDGCWIVRRTEADYPDVLHSPEEAGIFVAAMQLAARRTALEETA
ncbi:hypothetical protein [Embleya sp. NPDC059237]|uniref:hypothetical protein n=1 Tax=unclassified Embleya TaxID=2699296 RepID=UPI00367EBF10